MGPHRYADTVFIGGAIWTMDPARPRAGAIAVRDGRIVAVGSVADIAEHLAPRTRRIDLSGRTLLPGFQDAHVHPSMAAIELQRCALHGMPPVLDSYLDAIRAYASAHPGLPWVEGAGWYMQAFPGGAPRASDLDRAVPDRPACFDNRDGHGAWVNSGALALAGITATTPDPPHGRIERDADGEPTGTLHEAAVDLVRDQIPEPTHEERVTGLGLAQEYLHRFGITAWQDAWVTHPELDAYVSFAVRGLLTARATVCHWWERGQGAEQIDSIVERRRRADGIGRLRANTVKVMQDGVAENFTAAMLHPYFDAGGRPTANRGMSFVAPDSLKRHVAKLDRLGFQVHFHALGDRAVRESLDAIEAALVANGPRDGRHHLAHLQVVDPQDYVRFARLGATATIQPLWACSDKQMVELTLPFLGTERCALQYPFASLRDAGARLAGGSDWTVSTPNVLAEAEVAVTRRPVEARDSEPFLLHQALGIEETLAAFTRGSAFVNHLDRETGTIEPGKLADLVVLDRDLDRLGDTPLGDVGVLLTLVEGEAVYEAAGLD